MKKVIIQHEQRTHAGSETGMGIAIAPNTIGVKEYQAVGRSRLNGDEVSLGKSCSIKPSQSR
ncbi:MAG TPA: hypothetical protein V6D43_15500 [Candidatus Sericytochromatia bacterium]